MTISMQNLEEKPYNLCLNCAHIGKNCDGPNFLTMSADRWAEWCRLRKEYLGWTNAHVAELSGVAKVTVDRIMAGNIKDARLTTMQAVTKVLVNGSWGQYPCAMPGEASVVESPELLAKIEESEKECNRLRAELNSVNSDHRAVMLATSDDKSRIAFLMDQIKFKEEQMVTKDRQLAERYDFMVHKDRVIRNLTIGLILAVLLILLALVADRLNPDIGFLWVDQVAAMIDGGAVSDIGFTDL